jgi:hypothetical protein
MLKSRAPAPAGATWLGDGIGAWAEERIAQVQVRHKASNTTRRLVDLRLFHIAGCPTGKVELLDVGDWIGRAHKNAQIVGTQFLYLSQLF